jgi:peptidoglycan hydrolase-like protein with peptidoglycan-binding domain
MSLQATRLRTNQRLCVVDMGGALLRQGETGEAVEILQQALIDLKFPMPRTTKPGGLSDGIFGGETTATVKAFQRKEGLVVDGFVGPKTLQRFDSILMALQINAETASEADVNAPMPRRKFHGS